MSAELRLAMLGMIPGNGHPYSWSAIVNGYDPAAMALCPYPVIPQYLGARPLSEVRIPGARVTHIWTDDPADAPLVAAAAMIPNVVARPEDVIGEVDGVILYTLQFCTPYSMESMGIEKELEKLGIPAIRIETDYSQEDVGQLKTRVQAFIERIRK